jgi:hypothetical protein
VNEAKLDFLADNFMEVATSVDNPMLKDLTASCWQPPMGSGFTRWVI